MVDALIELNSRRAWALTLISPFFTRISTSSGRKGWNRLEHNLSTASQATLRAEPASRLYNFGRPFFSPVPLSLFLRSNLIAAFRCSPVAAINSSSIFVFAVLVDLKYRSRIAFAYSSMLRRVTFPPFGNTIFDATIPFSVTLIMSQCAGLTPTNTRATIQDRNLWQNRNLQVINRLI